MFQGEVANKPIPRRCVLRKSEPSDEYGFNLHAENGKGHFIGTVDPDSIAQKSGLEEGQRIVGVNGSLVFVDTPHKEVVKLIKQQPASVELLVASPAVDEWYKDHHAEYSFSMAENYPDTSAFADSTDAVSNVEQLETHVSEMAVNNASEENGIVPSGDHEQEVILRNL
ncbi:unnamed protein product [Soboliphyme baturini]|uniref:PDZ domain-containing protein n=1 Tax=Soboliphyme baturini TaxID=241478 RepID=A0A3P8D2W7_9BILA|nr:unnamed protein product [Soboliphyme baturini]